MIKKYCETLEKKLKEKWYFEKETKKSFTEKTLRY